MDSNKVIHLDDNDNVVIACYDIKAHTIINYLDIETIEDIPAGYKCAIKDIKKGQPIIKYNTIIGYASCDILKGQMIHNHNDNFEAHDLDYAFCKDYHEVNILPENKRRTFLGYKRDNGKVATRNYIGIIVCSNCAATVARKIANHFTSDILKDYPNVDGVVPFITELGCGMEQSGEPLDLLQRTIAGYINNPNMGASVLVAIGCERNNIDNLISVQNLKVSDNFKRLVIQEEGGTNASILKGIEYVNQMLPIVNNVKREECSAEHLLVALECGGSDGFSGLSANPALGRAMDILVKNGGSFVMSETTEIFGAEHLLTRRAKTKDIGQKLVDRLNWWLKQTEGRNCQINGKVSPGNNKGGLTNVLEKSLGGVKKSGSSPLNAVYEYAYPIKAKGFSFMDTPGYDPIASTGQIAGGANVLCFTTGRGSCFGSVLTPVIKIASNTPLYNKMTGDMDINCGQVIDGDKTLDEMGQIIFEQILKVASGEKTKSEQLGVGEDEFAPWPIGVYA